MLPVTRKPLLLLLMAFASARAAAQSRPDADDSRDWVMRGALEPPVAASARDAGDRCLTLPVDSPDDRLQGPHGNSLVAATCSVIATVALDSASPSRWSAARYRWTSLFTAEDTSRGPAGRDTVTEEEVVLLEMPEPGRARAAWHARFETGPYAVWRSITPELAFPGEGALLLSVMACVNGTGGCNQEFLQRRADGRWRPVRQSWLNQLPPGFADRLQHGMRIQPRTLRGHGGFYGPQDPNCCPAEELEVWLELRGDSMVLQKQDVRHAE